MNYLLYKSTLFKEISENENKYHDHQKRIAMSFSLN